jgi:hypothetical protein
MPPQAGKAGKAGPTAVLTNASQPLRACGPCAFPAIPMDLYPDFKEFFQLLNEESVEYTVGGGYAVAWHGYPRYTGDIGIWIHATPDNASRMMPVLQRFGAGNAGITEFDFLNPEIEVLKMGREPIRVDMMTRMKGLDFPTAYPGRETRNCGGVIVSILCLRDLRTAKKAANRAKDQNDLEHLPEA